MKPSAAKVFRLLLSGAMALGPPLSAAATTQGPQHVMSLSLCTDALLLELLPLNRIASVTYLSRNPSDSFLSATAAKVPINYGSAEEVLAEKPDFVLAGTYTTPATRMLLKKVGIQMLEVPPANNFDDNAIVFGTSYWIKLVENALMV